MRIGVLLRDFEIKKEKVLAFESTARTGYTFLIIVHILLPLAKITRRVHYFFVECIVHVDQRNHSSTLSWLSREDSGHAGEGSKNAPTAQYYQEANEDVLTKYIGRKNNY